MRRIYEMTCGLNRPIIVEVIMAAFGKADELLGLVCEGEQAFAEADRDHGVAAAMHDQERHGDRRNPLIRME